MVSPYLVFGLVPGLSRLCLSVVVRGLLHPLTCNIFDSDVYFLTPEEERLHRAQWPRFLEARAKGQAAQFRRARLVVKSGADP